MTIATPKLNAGTIALFVSIDQSIRIGGGSIDLHTENRGNKYAPKNPTYVVGGVVPGLAYHSFEFVNQSPDKFNDFIKSLTNLIEQGEQAGGTVVGWWTDPKTDSVHFDVSDEYNAEFNTIKLPVKVATQRGEIAIGLFLNGEYAHTINVL